MNEKPSILAELSSPELATIISRIELAVIAIGSCEQHGPNMSLRADTAIADALAQQIVQRLAPRALLLPAIPYGFSYLHRNFPGMISLRSETIEAIFEDIVVSLKNLGIGSLLIVNGHGHNMPCLQVAMTNLRHKHKVKIATCFYITLASDVIRSRIDSSNFGHACQMEVSVALHLAPHIVKNDQLADGDIKPWPPHSRGPAAMSWPFTYDQITSNGVLGNAPVATAEFGREITETTVERTIEFVEAVLASGTPEWD